VSGVSSLRRPADLEQLLADFIASPENEWQAQLAVTYWQKAAADSSTPPLKLISNWIGYHLHSRDDPERVTVWEHRLPWLVGLVQHFEAMGELRALMHVCALLHKAMAEEDRAAGLDWLTNHDEANRNLRIMASRERAPRRGPTRRTITASRSGPRERRTRRAATGSRGDPSSSEPEQPRPSGLTPALAGGRA
jgi:hypothetical protein